MWRTLDGLGNFFSYFQGMGDEYTVSDLSINNQPYCIYTFTHLKKSKSIEKIIRKIDRQLPTVGPYNRDNDPTIVEEFEELTKKITEFLDQTLPCVALGSEIKMKINDNHNLFSFSVTPTNQLALINAVTHWEKKESPFSHYAIECNNLKTKISFYPVLSDR